MKWCCKSRQKTPPKKKGAVTGSLFCLVTLLRSRGLQLRTTGIIALYEVHHHPVGNQRRLGLAFDFHCVFRSQQELARIFFHGILHGLDYYLQTVELFASGRVDPTKLIARVAGPGAASEMFKAMVSPNRSRPKYVIEFAGEAA